MPKKQAVRHTKLVCLTASFLATGGISKCMHGPQACLFKYITVAAFCINALRGEDATKGEVGGRAFNSHGNYTIDHGKSWNCVFEFLWEP